MARQAKKNVYKRIEEQQAKIKEAEMTLAKLNDELHVLFAERDELQMHQLFDKMKSQGLDIDKALDILSGKKITA